ncbi:MAG TPA: NADAR family protein [Candidatus Saccharimonadales bacterium]|nr:NADAR family protein [Candidatus Saccharimonadales bacterium]
MPIYFYDQWYDVLNNFSANAVEIDGVLYPTSEHAYQAAKCTDPVGKHEILVAKSPLLAKEVSNQKYKSAKDPDWNTKKLSVMESILRSKLDQHQEVRNALMKSGDEEIAEDSPIDAFWGRGKDGNGENQLGKLWMKIRSEL